MWPRVQRDLAQILGKEVFWELLSNPSYAQMLRNAGIEPSRRAPLSIADFQRLAEHAKLRALLGRRGMEQFQSMRESDAKAVVLNGPFVLYRLWDDFDPTRAALPWAGPRGEWWFDENLFQASLSAGPSLEARREFLRDKLAVAYDWSRLNRLSILRLSSRLRLPVVKAFGLPMPKYSKNPVGPKPPRYFELQSQLFSGGALQYYVPWVPPQRVQDLTFR